MKYTAIVEDQVLIKDGVPVWVTDDNTFWAQFSGVHAVQIDTEGESWVELTDVTQRDVTDDEETAIINKYAAALSAQQAAEAAEAAAWQNSWDRVRQERDFWLAKTDVYMVSDYPVTSAKKTEWQTYRTSLRNLPTTYSSESPEDITFDASGNVSVSGSVVISVPS